MVYDRMTVFYITKFTETAEQEMIKAPDNSNEMAEWRISETIEHKVEITIEKNRFLMIWVWNITIDARL